MHCFTGFPTRNRLIDGISAEVATSASSKARRSDDERSGFGLNSTTCAIIARARRRLVSRRLQAYALPGFVADGVRIARCRPLGGDAPCQAVPILVASLVLSVQLAVSCLRSVHPGRSSAAGRAG